MKTRLITMASALALALAAAPFAAEADQPEKTLMPASPHQEKAIEGAVESVAPKSAPGAIPATPHQREVLPLGEGGDPVTGVPASPHQEEVLGDVEAEIPATAESTSESVREEPFPATEHQEDALEID